MSTETDLLRVIRDHPDEDTPRLMFADHLEELGDSARAEFIRVQIERSQLPDTDPRRRALEDREHELLSQNESQWLGVSQEDADELTEWEFDRGFLNEVAASPVFMNGPGTDLCAAHPVRRWRVMSGRGTNFREDLREAGQRAWCDRLVAIDLSGWYASIGELSGFLTRSGFARLRELDLTGRGPLDPVPELIEFAPFRDRLGVLRCGAVGYDGDRLDAADLVRSLGGVARLVEFAAPQTLLTAPDLGDLFSSAAFAQLGSLDLRNNQIDVDSCEPFRTARFRLRELDLSGTPLGSTGLAPLLASPALSELRALHLNSCGFDPAAVRAIVGSRFWAQAEELRVQQGELWDANPEYEGPVPPIPGALPGIITELFAAPGSPHLRVLDLSGNAIGDGGFARCCAAQWGDSLTYLDLPRNGLTDTALIELAGCGRFRQLRTLHLNDNGAAEHGSITDVGLRALADSPSLANLRVLSLGRARITAAGLDALLNSPHIRLTGLAVSGCDLQGNAIDVLASSPRTARLELLDLSGNGRLGTAQLKPLAESTYLSPLTEMDVRGTGIIGSSVRAALRERLGRRLSE